MAPGAEQSAAELADDFLVGDADAVIEVCRRDSELAAAVGHALSAVLLQDSQLRLPRDDRRIGAWHSRQSELVTLAEVDGVDRPQLAEALAEVATRGWIDGQITMNSELTRLIAHDATDRLKACLANPGDYSTNYSLPKQLWGLPGAEGDAWFEFFLSSTDETHDLMEEMAFRGESAWSEGDWRSRMRVLSTTKLKSTPDLVKYHHAIIHAAPASAMADVLASILSYKAAPEDLQNVAKSLRTRITGDADLDARLFPWKSADAATVNWLAEATVGEQRFADVKAAAERVGLRDSGIEPDVRQVELSPSAQVDSKWQLLTVFDGVTVDAPTGVVAAADWLWLPDVEEPAWRVEVPVGEHACRVVLATKPLHEPVAAGSDLLISDRDVVEWEVLAGPRNEESYVSESSAFGIFDASWIEDVLLDEDQIDDDAAFEAVRAAEHAFAEIEAEEMRACYLMCATQHPSIRSWRGIDRDGKTARIVSSFEILDIDPVRDGQLPWD